MKVVEINDVSKTYHDTEVEVKAVNGVTLSFDKGDFAVIRIGTNSLIISYKLFCKW